MNGGKGQSSPPHPVTEALKDWRQGDCVVGDERFVHRFDPTLRLTNASKRVEEPEAIYAEDDVVGFVLLSQSCDIVRDAVTRPYVEVAPLVEVSEDLLRETRKLRRPNFVFIPGLRDKLTVGHLDRVMTVEKAVIARWDRTVGCSTDEERTAFAWALQRKHARFAFPDDFNEWVRPLQEQLTEKHDKETPEGRALRAIDEIRVKALPNWQATPVEVTFLFIPEGNMVEFEGKRWADWADRWLALVPPSGRFLRPFGVVGSLDDFKGRDLRESALLDLDYLSVRE